MSNVVGLTGFQCPVAAWPCIPYMGWLKFFPKMGLDVLNPYPVNLGPRQQRAADVLGTVVAAYRRWSAAPLDDLIRANGSPALPAMTDRLRSPVPHG